jgi:hypothetical protein
MGNDQKCVLCKDRGTEVHGYVICDACKSELGLFSDETIKKHIALYNNSEKKRSYEEEIH